MDQRYVYMRFLLTHTPLMLHIHAPVNWVSTGSDNGLSLVWRQAITWPNADVLSIGSLGANFSQIHIKIQNSLWPCDVIWRLSSLLTLLQVTACHIFGTKPLHKWWLLFIEPIEYVKFNKKQNNFRSRKLSSAKWWRLCSDRIVLHKTFCHQGPVSI